MDSLAMAKVEARMELWRTLSALKAKRGLSDQEIADRIGMKRSTVNSYTSGRAEPSLAALGMLAEALGVEPYVLLMKADDAVAEADRRGKK